MNTNNKKINKNEIIFIEKPQAMLDNNEKQQVMGGADCGSNGISNCPFNTAPPPCPCNIYFRCFVDTCPIVVKP